MESSGANQQLPLCCFFVNRALKLALPLSHLRRSRRYMAVHS
jgi:hypothetical protein